MKFTCQGCGNKVWEPENPTEHKPNCPNMKYLREKYGPLYKSGCPIITEGPQRDDL